MRARRSLRVVLHGKDGQPPVAHPLQALVVQVDMGHLHLPGREGIQVHAEPVVLGGDLHPAVAAGSSPAGWLPGGRISAYRSCPPWPGPGAGGPGRSRRSASSPGGPAPFRRCRSGPPGPRGRWKEKSRAGSAQELSGPSCCAGTTKTWHPRLARWRMMLCFIPKSMATTRYFFSDGRVRACPFPHSQRQTPLPPACSLPFSPLPTRSRARQVTAFTQSLPSIGGECRAFSIKEAGSRSDVEMIPRIAPAVRMMPGQRPRVHSLRCPRFRSGSGNRPGFRGNASCSG